MIRISGPATYAILEQCGTVAAPFPSQSGRVVAYAIALPDGELAAELWCFRAPRSYTGEDLAELHLLGWPVLVSEVLRLLQRAGARLARAGEFTQRAFLAGKLDLAQCNAVLRLSSARSIEVSRVAASLLVMERGENTTALREELLTMLAYLEAHLDFDEVEIAGADAELAARARALSVRIASMRTRWEALPASREHPQVAFFGRPSVGKSTLFNHWLGEERALVDEAPGTTRDLLRATARIGGREVELVDQPGRSSAEVDARERSLLQSADVLLCCVDAAAPELPESLPDHPRRLLVYLRSDRVLGEVPPCVSVATFAGRYAVSVHRGDGLPELEAAVLELLAATGSGGEDLHAPEFEQRDALRTAEERVALAAQILEEGLPFEIAAEELRSALLALDRISGSWSPEDLLDRIFARFCLGK